MKVAELEGPLLDYWVAKAEGHADVEISDDYTYEPHSRCGVLGLDEPEYYGEFSPSEDWTLAGPIIERERIQSEPLMATGWTAIVYLDNGLTMRVEGDTLLIAAMRAYVASKFGEEVG